MVTLVLKDFVNKFIFFFILAFVNENNHDISVAALPVCAPMRRLSRTSGMDAIRKRLAAAMMSRDMRAISVT